MIRAYRKATPGWRWKPWITRMGPEFIVACWGRWIVEWIYTRPGLRMESAEDIPGVERKI